MDYDDCIPCLDDAFQLAEDCEAWLHNLFLADFQQQFLMQDDFHQQIPIENFSQALSGSQLTSGGPSLSGECDTGNNIPHCQRLLRCRQENKRKVKTQTEKTQSKKKERKALEYGLRALSEKEAAEDGYKWRKYGRKSLKSSTYPRNYYRCLAEKCGVKKRVEKDPADNGMIIVTYEGFHNHECPSVSNYCIADI